MRRSLLVLMFAALAVVGCATTGGGGGDGGGASRYDVPDDIPEEATDEQKDLRALKILRQAQAAMIDGDLKGSIDLFKQALEIYRELGDYAAQAAIHNDLALILNAAGSHDRALELLQIALDLGGRGAEPTVVVEAQYNVGVVYYDMKRDEDAEAAYGEALSLAQAAGNLEMEGLALNGRGNVRRRTNNLVPAIDDYRAALKVWNRLGRPGRAAIAWQNIGYSHVLRGERDEAIQALYEAIEALKQTEGPDRDILIPHLEELDRMVKTDAEAARKKVLEVLGRPVP